MSRSILHLVRVCQKTYQIVSSTTRPNWANEVRVLTARPTDERSQAVSWLLCTNICRHPHPCDVLLSARRASKQAMEQAHSKAQCLTPTKGRVSSRGGSLSNSFRFVPLSQHLSERRERDRRRIKRVRGAKAGTFVCLWSEMFLLNTFYFLYLRHTHAKMTQFSDSVITCWWGTASTAQWGGVCLCNQTVCAGPEARRRHSSWLVCVWMFSEAESAPFLFFSLTHCTTFTLRWTILWWLSHIWATWM